MRGKRAPRADAAPRFAARRAPGSRRGPGPARGARPATLEQKQIAEGLARIEAGLRAAPAGPYALQAAISACHARAVHPEDTDWRQIAALYQLLLRLQPSPVVELNHAVAVAMVDGAARGLMLLDSVERRGGLDGYHLLPAARAELLRRLERFPEAAVAYRAALTLVKLEPERRFLERRLAEVERD